MYAIRCTRKLLDRGAPAIVASPPSATTVLGDWYANLVFTRPEQLVVCLSEKTLLAVVVPAKDITRLTQRIAAAVAGLLSAIDVPTEDVAAELSDMTQVSFAKTANRRVLGSLNDFVHHLQHGVGRDTGLSLHERSLRLSRMPCGAIEYAYPTEAALAAFATRRALDPAMRSARAQRR